MPKQGNAGAPAYWRGQGGVMGSVTLEELLLGKKLTPRL